MGRGFTLPIPGRAGVLAAVFLLAACATEPDEAALRGRIAELQVAVEARDAGALAEVVADDFGGPDGMDREGLRRYATLMLLRQQRVGVVLGPIEVELHGDRAAARFDAVVTGADRLLPEGVEARRVETVWRREGDEWILVGADWRRPAGGV